MRKAIVGLTVLVVLVALGMVMAPQVQAAGKVRTTIGISEDGQWFRISAGDLYPPGRFWMRLDDLVTVYSDDLRPTIPEGDWGFIGRKTAQFKAYAAVAWPGRF